MMLLADVGTIVNVCPSHSCSYQSVGGYGRGHQSGTDASHTHLPAKEIQLKIKRWQGWTRLFANFFLNFLIESCITASTRKFFFELMPCALEAQTVIKTFCLR